MLNTQYIRELLDDHNWSIGKLAIKSGISKAQISRILSNKRGAGEKTIQGLLKAFPEVDMKRLFFTDDVTF